MEKSLETAIDKIDERLAFLESYKKTLKTDPTDDVPPSIKESLRAEGSATDIRIEELERLKKQMYKS